jgi:hypothetical protein
MKGKFKKDKHTQEYIGCTWAVYKAYLTARLGEGMTWENYGTVWHIDHVTPLFLGNPTEEEVKQRLHFSNTQPMLAYENISKGNRYIGKYKDPKEYQ